MAIEGFGDCRLQNIEAAFWRCDGELANSSAKRSLRGEHRGAHHAVGAGEEHRRAEVGFRGELFAAAEAALHVALLDKAEFRRGLGGGFLAEADVEHLPLAD